MKRRKDFSSTWLHELAIASLHDARSRNPGPEILLTPVEKREEVMLDPVINRVINSAPLTQSTLIRGQ